MAGVIDTLINEKQVGRTAAKTLQTNIRTLIKQRLNKNSGDAEKTRVTARFRQDRLDRLTITAPRYVFVQNAGFEGSKRNGVTMRLKAQEVISEALAQNNFLETLADSISEIRSEQVVAAINIGTR